MVTIRAEIPSDFAKREALLNAAFGVRRFRKTSEKLRHGRLAAAGLIAASGRVLELAKKVA